MILEHARHRLLAMCALLSGLTLLAACTGGDDDGGGGPLTADQAAVIAAGALLEVGDLPDGDWEQADGQFSLQSLLPDGGGGGAFDLSLLPSECESFENAIGDLPALLGDATPLETRGRSFTMAGQLLNFQAVSSSVVVFEEPEGAREAMALLEEAFSADSLESCILAAKLGTGGNSDILISEFSLSTPSYALDDSTALTATIDAVAVILPVNLAVDLHAFRRGNVLALYVGLELNSADLADEHGGLLATFANRVLEAQN